MEDIPGTQRSQRHFSSLQSSDRLKKWIQSNPELDELDDNEDEDVLFVRMDDCNDINNRGCGGG